MPGTEKAWKSPCREATRVVKGLGCASPTRWVSGEPDCNRARAWCCGHPVHKPAGKGQQVVRQPCHGQLASLPPRLGNTVLAQPQARNPDVSPAWGQLEPRSSLGQRLHAESTTLPPDTALPLARSACEVPCLR